VSMGETVCTFVVRPQTLDTITPSDAIYTPFYSPTGRHCPGARWTMSCSGTTRRPATGPALPVSRPSYVSFTGEDALFPWNNLCIYLKYCLIFLKTFENMSQCSFLYIVSPIVVSVGD